MYYSSLLKKEFESQEALDKAEAYHNRIKEGSSSEKKMQEGAEKEASGGWSNLRKLFASK